MLRALLLLLAALAALAPTAHAQKRIALTFDDVPRNRGAFLSPRQRTEALIASLKRARVAQAAFFVNPGFLANPDGADGEAHIRAYVAAGHVLGNHSFDHPHLNARSAEEYLSNIDRAAAWLKGRKGYRPWFRFPFLDEGDRDKAKRDAVRAGLAARGLRNGYVTVDGGDWNIEALTIAAMKAGKPIDLAALKDLYIGSHVESANFHDALAKKTLGRSPAHVLLLHETDLAALFVADLVEALRADGWEIVTADQAFADPISRLFPDVPSARGTLTESLAWEKGLPAPRWYEFAEGPPANKRFAERVLHEAPAGE
jgi:peptidoglycan-N-acetylglucosamine deacetylase